MNTRRRLLDLDRPDCLRRLAAASVGRLAYTADALPAVRPALYLLDTDGIVIRTPITSSLAARGEEVVAFEVDDICPHTLSGWSVVVTGRATEVRDPARRDHLRAALRSWGQRPDDRIIRISCDLIAGCEVP